MTTDKEVWIVRFPHHPASLLGEKGEGVEPVITNDFAAIKAMGLKLVLSVGEHVVRRDYRNMDANHFHSWSGTSSLVLGNPREFLIHEDFRNDGEGPEPYYFFFETERDARAWVRAWELCKELKASPLDPGMTALRQRTQQLIQLFQLIRVLANPAQAEASVLVFAEEGEAPVAVTLMGDAAALELFRAHVANVP